jgi:hypothetical protein
VKSCICFNSSGVLIFVISNIRGAIKHLISLRGCAAVCKFRFSSCYYVKNDNSDLWKTETSLVRDCVLFCFLYCLASPIHLNLILNYGSHALMYAVVSYPLP